MSLLVWLPMTKDLTQQGLSDLTVSNNGATLNNNGKLGKCYYFDGSDDYINLGSSIGSYFDTSPISFTFWIKSLENGTRGVIFGSYGSSSETNYFNIEVNSGSHSDNALRFCWKGLETYSSAGMVTYNAWVHIAVVWDGTKVSFYKNGTLLNSNAISPTSIPTGNTYYIGRDGRTGGTAFYGYLNDFRFYDHALSAKEVEVLSRGLVCHYPLNGGGRGGDNLLKNTEDLTLWTKESGITTTWDSEKNLYKIVDSTHTSSRWGIYQDLDITANTTYTITCTLDGNSCGVGFGFYDSSISVFPSAVMSTSGTKLKQSYTITSGASSTKCRIYLYTNCGTSTTAWFGLPKLEVGSKATPWIPNSADAAYTAMGYNSTTEYDCSGYQYNLDSHGSITYSSDTPRYSVCPYYQNTNMYLSATSPTDSVRTVSFWVKYPSAWSEYRVAFADYKSKLSFGFVNASRVCCTCSSNLKATFNITTPTVNTWYHVVVRRVSDSIDADIDLFINGVQQTSRGANDNWNHTTDTLMIGRRSTGASIIGYMSDFRAYSTILSDTQIAELYNTAVSMANNGTLMGYELVEG